MKDRRHRYVRPAIALLTALLLAGNLTACTSLEQRPGSGQPSVPLTEVSLPACPDPSSDDTTTSEAPSSEPASSEASGEPLPLSSILEAVSSRNQEVKPPESSAPSSAPSSEPSSEPSSQPSSEPSSAPASEPGVDTPAEMRAVWLSYLEFQAFAGSDEAAYTAKICTILNQIAAKGLNTVIVQVRPYGDSFYPSAYYPWSKCISGTVDLDPGYDPLAILLREGHARGLSIHAWINPYRVMTDTEFAAISDAWTIKQWYNSAHRDDYMLRMEDGRWWLKPGNGEVQQLIEDGVDEILASYAVDGIHLDDYFYNVDPAQYGDSKSEAQANTTALVRTLYRITKAYGAEKLFGISPMGAYRENADLPASDTGAHSTDLALWCSTPGYIDYVMPQIYWEYTHETQPFTMTLEKWENFVTEDSVALYIGLAPYKLAADEIRQQILDVGQSGRAAGYCLFRYDHIAGLDLS